MIAMYLKTLRYGVLRLENGFSSLALEARRAILVRWRPSPYCKACGTIKINDSCFIALTIHRESPWFKSRSLRAS